MSGPTHHTHRTWWTQQPPAAGAAVMATGIVSVGLHLTGYEFLSRVALAVLALLWLGLVLYGLALARFDLRQVTAGTGDQWVAGGARSPSRRRPARSS